MSHDKELIERLALEVAKNISFEHRAPLSDTSIITFATRLLAAYLAERGKEAVAWHTDDHLTDKSATTYDSDVAERWKAKGWPVTPHFLAPQPAIPEGMALVPIEPTEAMIEAGKWQIQVLNGLESAYKAVIAAAGVKPCRKPSKLQEEINAVAASIHAKVKP